MQNKRKQKKPNEIKFSTKSRFEYLEGFSKRKQERQKKGNLKNLKKQIKEKREEQNLYKQHIQTEYQRSLDASKHNYNLNRTEEEPVAEPTTPEITDIIQEESVYFPTSQNDDVFGEVTVHVTSLESPEYSTLTRVVNETMSEAPKKAMPTQAKLNTVKKSVQKRKKHTNFKRPDKSAKKKVNGLKRVKSAKPTKKSKK